MYSAKLIKETKQFVRRSLDHEGTGHDWWHAHRVHENACLLLKTEQGDRLTIELAALMHDIADWKFYGGDESRGPAEARRWLESLAVNTKIIDHVCSIIATMSFKGADTKDSMTSNEGKIVQDADRLDALGAIGIARAIAYGGYKQRSLYDPEYSYNIHQDTQTYKNNTSSAIAYFYEKLLFLKNRMHTPAAYAIAVARHHYMEQFFSEWDGSDANRILEIREHGKLHNVTIGKKVGAKNG